MSNRLLLNLLSLLEADKPHTLEEMDQIVLDTLDDYEERDDE